MESGMMLSHHREQIAHLAGCDIARLTPLQGGCIGEVYCVELVDGSRLAAKVAERASGLEIEGRMLTALRQMSALPVPDVLYSAPDLLLMTWLDGDSHLTPTAQRHAAELVAALHSIQRPAPGLEWDTLIGGLPQPNAPAADDRWLTFFRERRLLYMTQEAARAGRLPGGMAARIERLAGQLESWLDEPDGCSLLHGDLWTTNILVQDGRITGFIDPAIYFGHPEIELAFSTLFGTFGQPFFEVYHALRPIEPGFFEARRDLYNLYPLLVHARLFGGGYGLMVDSTLRRFGC